MNENCENLSEFTRSKWEISIRCKSPISWKVIEKMDHSNIFSLSVFTTEGTKDIQSIWNSNLDGKREFDCECGNLKHHEVILIIFDFF